MDYQKWKFRKFLFFSELSVSQPVKSKSQKTIHFDTKQQHEKDILLEVHKVWAVNSHPKTKNVTQFTINYCFTQYIWDIHSTSDEWIFLSEKFFSIPIKIFICIQCIDKILQRSTKKLVEKKGRKIYFCDWTSTWNRSLKRSCCKQLKE